MIDNSSSVFIKTNLEKSHAKISENTGAIFTLLTESTYKFPKLAGVREIISNALDATRRARSKEAIVVFAPSNLEPTFSVEDFGIGLTGEEILDLYTSLGASSKKDKEDEIGFFGIGALSPLAYTQQFNVQSNKDGVTILYTVFAGEDGVPNVSKIFEKSTGARNGTKVSYFIKKEDIAEFNKCIQNVLTYIDPSLFSLRGTQNAVNYYKEELKRNKNIEYIFDDRIYIIRKSIHSTSKNTIIMGGVCYEFDPTFLGEKLFKDYTLTIDAKLGDVSVQASRENLRMNAKTTGFIKSVILYIFDNIQKDISDKVQKCATFRDAHTMLHNIRIIDTKNITWKNLKLDFLEMMIAASNYFTVYFKFKSKNEKFDPVIHPCKNEYNNVDYKIYLDDVPKGGIKRIPKDIHCCIVFVQKTPEKTKEFTDIYGNFLTLRTSSIEQAAGPSRAPLRKKEIIYKINTGAAQWSTFYSATSTYTPANPAAPVYFLKVKNKSVIYGEVTNSLSLFYEIKSICPRDIILVDWKSDPPDNATCLMEWLVKNVEQMNVAEKDHSIHKMFSTCTTPFSVLYNHRADYKTALNNFTPNRNNDKLGNKASLVNDISSLFNLNIKINNSIKDICDTISKDITKITNTNYPLYNLISPFNLHSQHAISYITQGDQNVFSTCFK